MKKRTEKKGGSENRNLGTHVAGVFFSFSVREAVPFLEKLTGAGKTSCGGAKELPFVGHALTKQEEGFC